MLWGENFQWVPAKLCGHNFEKKSVKLFSDKLWEKSKGFIAIT